ncbi:MAG: PHP domain-containing protein [Pseudomonadota bacterium]|jgi:predicted metal-dependent phosphoesterase TrpH|nr:PHP domain-containing protein [Pseudomonadota bacterium]
MKSSIAAGRADPRRINADLHCHSLMSDGTLSPSAVVERAAAQGVEMLALTDHDNLAGLGEAAARAAGLGLPFVPGVEVSVTWGGETIHVVGLNVDPQDATLEEGLARTRSGRDARAVEIGEQLAAVGIPGAYEGALRYVGNPALVSRTHFARFLVERGFCRDVSDVFSRFLVEGRPGFVPQRWAAMDEAVEWILRAGGQAVLAHPGRYRLDRVQHHAMISDFRDAGGVAIEVVSGSHTVAQYAEYARVAVEFGLLASRGSDFHGPGESHVELGQVPPLPDSVVPVWHDWEIAA